MQNQISGSFSVPLNGNPSKAPLNFHVLRCSSKCSRVKNQHSLRAVNQSRTQKLRDPFNALSFEQKSSRAPPANDLMYSIRIGIFPPKCFSFAVTAMGIFQSLNSCEMSFSRWAHTSSGSLQLTRLENTFCFVPNWNKLISEASSATKLWIQMRKLSTAARKSRKARNSHARHEINSVTYQLLKH